MSYNDGSGEAYVWACIILFFAALCTAIAGNGSVATAFAVLCLCVIQIANSK
jgi:mannose/fructose/N-acetylgalactosamine-specific phosphotransferase system component IID